MPLSTILALLAASFIGVLYWWAIAIISTQTEASKTDAYHYKVVYRPETLVPDIDIKTSGKEG